mmetsp:Transcript_48352/g.108598  ORF Transcript_48352/g.108598 Transcript_48352/m.108598 type:complete len:155 (-) Transcript_48352:73-537(-)
MLLRAAPACTAYLAGIVATELVVFDCGPPKAAYWFYKASLPSLTAFPQALRIAVPVVHLSICILFAILARERRKRIYQRRYYVSAAMLVGPGLLSLVKALQSASRFCSCYARIGFRKAAAIRHLEEVRWWHTVMLITLLCVLWNQMRAEISPGR